MKWNLSVAGAGPLLIAVLCACSPGNTNAPDSSRTAAPSDAPARNRARPAAATPPARTAGAPACPYGAELVFGCRIADSSKAVTLCATQGARPQTTYRFADGARTELLFSDASAANAGAFHRTPLSFAGATGGYVYSFRNADATYALYSISGNDGLARAGIAVLDASDRKKANLECDPGTVQETDSIELIRRTRGWTPDPAVANAVQ